MGQPDAARLRGVRWILLGLGLMGASFALTAQPAHAGLTDRLVSSTTKVTQAVHHAVHESSRTKATTRATTKAKSVARHVVRQAKPAPVVRQLASRPVVKIIKHTEIERVAPVVTTMRATVHRVVSRAVTPVEEPVKNLPKPVASMVVPAAVAAVDLPVRSTAAVSTATSRLRSSPALPVVAVVSTSPTDRAIPTLAPTHELAPSHRARAAAASPESRSSTPLVPQSDPAPAPAPAGASSAATSAPGSASTKATLIDPAHTGADPSLDRMVGVAAGPWSLTRDPGFCPD